MSTCADSCQDDLPVEKPRLLARREVRASLAAWVFILVGFAGSWLSAPSTVLIASFAVAILSGSWFFAREAIVELVRERRVGIELLMTVAIAAAAALGRWREAALVAGLYSISEAVEGFTIQRTRHAIRDLMRFVPPKARVIRNGMETEVPVESLAVGDRFRVRPGESIATDGIVREGNSAVNESAITGESLPVDRGTGDSVFAGTLNGNGSLVVEATKGLKDNTVSKIIELVESAQKQKGETQLFVERFGRVYSPLVLLGSGAIAVIAIVVGSTPWLIRAATLLVAAAPCALAVATPVTLVAAIGSAAKRGVLIKGGKVVEDLGAVRAVAIDKTGTLTAGKLSVSGIHTSTGSEGDLLSKAASIEHLSEHPIARAIVGEAERRGIQRQSVSDFKAVTAAGVYGLIDGRRIAVLKPAAALLEAPDLPSAGKSWIEEAQNRGETVGVVLLDGRYAGSIALSDTIRPESASLLQSLRRAGVQRVVMLTGDNQGTARSVAKRIGMTEFHAGLLPDGKIAKIAEMKAAHGRVAMVGDGINDAPALAAASVGIAMGTGGSDAAIAAADIALVRNDLSRLAYAFDLGRRSRRVILQNIVLSLIIVGVLVLGTLFAGLSMLAAVVAHEGSEVLIILNGFRVAIRSRSHV